MGSEQKAGHCESGHGLETCRLFAASRPRVRQTKAIRQALESRLTLIQGPPGTGKTTTACNLILAAVRLRRSKSRSDGKVSGWFARMCHMSWMRRSDDIRPVHPESYHDDTVAVSMRNVDRMSCL